MEKRYQIFVSSTFTDLQQERQGLMHTLMQLDAIPAGMELFPATDEEQWAFIQKVIDDCDYYLLVIGGRYGSTTAEGVSYTEKEHDYAVSKGIPVIALLHGEPEKLPLEKSELNSSARERLTAFRAKVSRGRLVKYWKSAPELLQQTTISLIHAFKAHPRPGWIRGGSSSNTELLEQLNALRQKNDDLNKRLSEMSALGPLDAIPDLASADSTFSLHGTFILPNFDGRRPWKIEVTWNEIIAAIGPQILSPVQGSDMGDVIGATVLSYKGQRRGYGEDTDLAVVDTIKVQLLALGYIKVENGSWVITEVGKHVMFRTRTVKAPEEREQ